MTTAQAGRQGLPVAKVSIQLGLRFGAGPQITNQADSQHGVWFRDLWQGAATRLCSNKNSSITREQKGQGQGSLWPEGRVDMWARQGQSHSHRLCGGWTEETCRFTPTLPISAQLGSLAFHPPLTPPWLVVLAEITLCLFLSFCSCAKTL